MYYSLYPQKDTTITDASIRGVSKTGSNSGQSEILEVYVLTSSLGNRGKARVLLQFDIDNISGSTVDGDIPTSSVEYRLRMKNSAHYQKNPSSFTLEVVPLSRSWDEGVGLSMHDEELKDSGYANWVNATTLVSWDSAGGDIVPDYSITQSFDTGFEDLDIDISPIVYAWLTGGVPNNGLMLKFIDGHETGSADLYVKKFYSRQALVAERRPRLEARWEENIFDDRGNINYARSGSLYYYRYINGVAQNVSEPVYVDIIDSSSVAVQTLTASRESDGRYLASGALVTFTSSTQIYRDVWYSGSVQYFTGTFTPKFATGSAYFNFNEIDVLLPNLQPEYDMDQKIVIRVFGKEENYAPAIRQTASLDPSPLILGDSYYQIENNDTEEVIVPFSTGSNRFSKLSYDKNGNYFKLWTKSFAPENIYRVKILVFFNGQKYIFDKNWTFKILND